MLADCVGSLLRQSLAPDRFEIVVVDDASTDATVETVRELSERTAPPRISLVRHEFPRGPNACRNSGFAAAGSDLFCFIDDDVLVPEPWLDAVLRGAERYPQALCLGGPIRLRLEGTPPRHCGGESLSEGEFDAGPDDREVVEVYSGNMVVRRVALDVAGQFDEELPIYHEETEWESRLRARGGLIMYVADAWLWHRRTADQLRLHDMVRRRFRNGVGYASAASARNERVSARRALRRLPRLAAHGLRRRCWWGALGAAYQLGVAYGALRPRSGRESLGGGG